MSAPPPNGPGDPGSQLSERILQSLPGLTRFVRRRMGSELSSHESATDIVQSTCRELLRGAASFEDRGEASFQRWVRSTAEHKLQNRSRHWRAQRRAEPPPTNGSDSLDAPPGERSAPPSARPSQEAMLHEEIERLERAFASVPEEHRRLLVRSQIEGATYAELALECGRTPEAVRKLVARALARLAAGLEDVDST